MQIAIQKLYTLKSNDLFTANSAKEYILKVSDLPEDEKPREKLIMLGSKALSVTELVAVLLGVGTKKEEVLTMSRRILREYGEKAIVNDTDPTRLAERLDIPIVKACQLISAFELGRRFFTKRGGMPVFIRNAKQAYAYLNGMASSSKEQLRGLYLNSRYQIIHDEVISVGTLTNSIVHPREVFQPAIENGAVAIILAHNHPSGSLHPTEADTQITKQLAEAGALLGIEVLDHIIVTEKRFSSIANEETLKRVD